MSAEAELHRNGTLVFSVQTNLYFAPLLAFSERHYINFLIRLLREVEVSRMK